MVALLMVAGCVPCLAAAEADLQAKLSELRAAGKPVTATELAPPPATDEDNAAPLYLRAAELIKAHAGEGDYGTGAPRVLKVGYWWYDRENPEHLSALAQLIEQDAELVALVGRATERPRCRFDSPWDEFLLSMSPQHASLRSVARFAAAAAYASSYAGNQDAALEHLRRGAALVRHMAEERTPLGFLNRGSCELMWMRAAETVLAGGPIPEESARELSAELERRDERRELLGAVQGQRVECLETFGQSIGGEIGSTTEPPREPAPVRTPRREAGGRVKALPYPPYDDLLAYLRLMDLAEEGIGRPWSEAAQGLRAVQTELERVPDRLPVARMLVPNTRTLWRRATVEAPARQLVIAALGLKLYRQQKGRLPDRLEGLAEIGWPVPQDCFADRALVYRREGERFLLYSIGPDLVDDGGAPVWSLERDRARRVDPGLPDWKVWPGDIPWQGWNGS